MKDNNYIPLSVPVINGNEWEYVKDCIDSSWVSSVGAYVDRFEKEICDFTGAGNAIACVNGTAALQVALRLVGVLPEDEVIVPTVTFIATVNVASYLGAYPVFMDCDDFYNIDIQKTVDFIENETVVRGGKTLNKKTGRLLKAVILVHVFGNAVDPGLRDLITLCRDRNIKIVEDAAESLGTYYLKGDLKGKYTGTIGDIGCFSFNGNKIITTGGGGMIVTNDKKYAEQARYLTTQAKDDPLRYIHDEVGYNFRLTNVLAAIGVAQLEQLPAYVDIKKRNYLAYRDGLSGIRGLRLAETPDYAESNHWFYCLKVNKDKYGKDVEEVMTFLSEHDIQARPIWHLNHLQKPYKDRQSYRIEKAFELFANTINIPCSVDLTKEYI